MPLVFRERGGAAESPYAPLVFRERGGAEPQYAPLVFREGGGAESPYVPRNDLRSLFISAFKNKIIFFTKPFSKFHL